jgi:hypothetical protein
VTATEAVNWLQASALSHAIAKSNHLVIASLQIVHVLGITLLLSSLTLMSLRLWGLLLKEASTSDIVRAGRFLVWLGVTLAIGSGALMFLASPRHYAYNSAFVLKMALLALAIAGEAVLLHAAAVSGPPRVAVRLGAGVTLALWLAVGVAGRAIGFL